MYKIVLNVMKNKYRPPLLSYNMKKQKYLVNNNLVIYLSIHPYLSVNIKKKLTILLSSRAFQDILGGSRFFLIGNNIIDNNNNK